MASVLIIGAGHNGLIAAAVLAREGHRVLMVERRPAPGGCLITEEIAPGCRAPVLSHTSGPLHPAVVDALGLDASLFRGNSRLCVLTAPSGAVLIGADRVVAAAGPAIDERDAASFEAFTRTVRTLSRSLTPLLTGPPPSPESGRLSTLLPLLASGRRARALGRRAAVDLLRWVPMPIADLVTEHVEDERLRASVAARGMFGRFAGPKSAGTTLELLLKSALSGEAIGRVPAKSGGPGALTATLVEAATSRGVQIRVGTAVDRLLADERGVRGARLASGEEVRGDVVVSNADPRHTFLELADPGWLGPGFVGDVQRIRSNGVVAKINLALAGLPNFRGLGQLGATERDAALGGYLQIGATLDYLERAFDAAKYGDFSAAPYLDITLPSAIDASLAPPNQHVLSVHVQFAPRVLRDRQWSDERDGLADVVLDTLEAYAPGLRSLVIARQVITPEDLEVTYGLSGGHPYHGEHALDQLFSLRPVYGWAGYRTPLRGLYLCGAGTHPGGGVHGLCGLNAARVVVRDLRGRR